MKVLITGGAGFIGSHIAERYLNDGHEVAVLDDLSTGSRDNVPREVPLFHGSICDAGYVHDVMKSFHPDVVSHHAGHVSVRDSILHPETDCAVNILGSVIIFQAAASAGVRRVIFASSGGAVYGNTSIRPTPENAPLRPESPYAVSKATGEQYLHYFSRWYPDGAIVLRYANIYGPRQRSSPESGVVSILCEKAMRGTPMTIFGDGRQTRDFVYVGDVADANTLALAGPAGTYNIGTGMGTSIRELVEVITAAVGCRVPTEHGEPSIDEVRDSVLSTTHAKRKLGFVARTALKSGLQQTVSWFAETTGGADRENSARR